jgi:hypothetical protein
MQNKRRIAPMPMRAKKNLGAASAKRQSIRTPHAHDMMFAHEERICLPKLSPAPQNFDFSDLQRQSLGPHTCIARVVWSWHCIARWGDRMCSSKALMVAAKAVAIIAITISVSCSPAKKSEKKQALALDPATLSAALLGPATVEAMRACGGAAASLPVVAQADFDGDGAPELVTDWSSLACARNTSAVCEAQAGCVHQVWRQGADGPSRIYQGQAHKALIVSSAAPSVLLLDHAGAACGRPADEICRVTYRWDARVRAMQEVAREIVQAEDTAR